MKAVKKFIGRYKHGLWMVLYMVFYMLGFFILENAGHRHYHVIHSVIDDFIPFCEYFIVPYDLWFLYITLAVCWFIFFCRDKREYYKMSCSLAIGMTLFLIVSCIYPNKQDLRPEAFANNNVFTRLVKALYESDTPTNILPSIHVYNSVAVFLALNSSPQLSRWKKVRFSCGLLSGLIILSTMLLKQHSVVDVSLGILGAIAVQMFVEYVFAPETGRSTKTGRITGKV